MKRGFLLIVLVITIAFSSFAQKRKIRDLEKQRKEVLAEIASTDKLLRETKKSTSTLLSRIKLIANQIESRKQVVSLLGQEVESINVEQVNIEQEIQTLESELKSKQGNYAKAVEAMMRNRKSENKLLFILSGSSLSESYRRLRYLREYSEKRSSQADEIKGKQIELQQKKDTLTQTKAEKIALLKQREIEQENLKNEEISFQTEMKEAQQKQSDLQQSLTQQKQQANKLNSQIERLIAEDIAQQERAAKARAQREAKAKGNTTTKTKTKTKNKTKDTSKAEAKTSATPTTSTASTEDVAAIVASSEDLKLAGTFTANRGKLPMPVTGNYTIITRFGTHRHEQWKSVTTSSNGIDIRARSGANARAVFDGEVTLVAAFPGYNNCVIIRHGNYYTFYGNIQSLSVKKGDKVKINQSLGSVYVNPDTGASELHFQLWQGTTKLNPEPWLKK